MTRRLDDIVADFDSLRPWDFADQNTGANGWERLEYLCGEMRAINDVVNCAPIIFRTMERLDDAELGAPGPLVHTLETWRGGYEELLIESLNRKPSPLAVWMVNRILNAKPSDKATWLKVLRNVADHPEASSATKARALHFLKYQTER
jgi:hypothetical protein